MDIRPLMLPAVRLDIKFNIPKKGSISKKKLNYNNPGKTMSLSGKVALITGSSRGIGKATVLHLANEGASVVINYIADESAANSIVAQIGSARALAIQADASSLADLDRLVDSAVAKFGKIDILVANAGILPMKDLENTTEADFDKTYNLMVKGPYFLAQVSTILYSCPKSWHSIITSSRKPQSTFPPVAESSLFPLGSMFFPMSRPLIFSMHLLRVLLIK